MKGDGSEREGASRTAETRIRQHSDPGPAIEPREARQPQRNAHVADKEHLGTTRKEWSASASVSV